MAQKRFKIITISLLSLVFIILIFVFVLPKFPKPSQKPSLEEKKEIQPTQKIEEAKPTETTRIDISNWKTYRSEDFGFEIKYPPDYVFQQRTTAGSAIPIKFSGEFISQKDLNKKEKPRECEIPGIFIEIYDREDFGINENQTLEEFIMGICKKEQIGEEKICEKLKIGDYEWIKAEWPDMCPEEDYYLEKNNLVYQFRSMTYEIEPILSTFKIFNIPLIKKQTSLCWAKTYGGGRDEEAKSIIQTNDGGYLLGGDTNSFGSDSDILVVKISSKGKERWARTYGGNGGDFIKSIIQTTDGGYVLAGYTNSFNSGKNNILVMKTDGLGNIQWAKIYKGTDNNFISSLTLTKDGGYILAGHILNGYPEVMKLDSNGKFLWAKVYKIGDSADASSIIPTNDGGYLLAGHRYLIDKNYPRAWGGGGSEYHFHDLLIMRLDSKGDTEWAKTYRVKEWNEFSSIKATNDGYILTGNTQPFGPGYIPEGLVIKLDFNGTIRWVKTYEVEEIRSITTANDGGYVLTGDSSVLGKGDTLAISLVKIDSSGNIEWAKAYEDGSYIKASLILTADDNGYIITGESTSLGTGGFDILVIKTDPDGNIAFTQDELIMKTINREEIVSSKINLQNLTIENVKNDIKIENSSLSSFDILSSLSVSTPNLITGFYGNSCK